MLPPALLPAKVLTAEELLNALKQHAVYSTAGGEMVRERAATEIRRLAKMQPRGGTVKDRVMHVSSALDKHFCENTEVDALYRARDGGYLPSPAESVSIALVDGISPSDFRNRVRTELTYVEGWTKKLNAVLRRMIDQAEAWKSSKPMVPAIVAVEVRPAQGHAKKNNRRPRG